MNSVLLVEDNPDDVLLFKRLFRKSQVNAQLNVAEDGQLAISYLAGDDPFQDRVEHPLPDLIFLDLKLPYKNGFEVLSWIRHNPELSNLPVVILSGSDEGEDQRQALRLGAQDYIVKPPAAEDLVRTIELAGLQ